MRTLLQMDYGKFLLLPVDDAGVVLEAMSRSVVVRRDGSKFPLFVPAEDGSVVELIFTPDENIACSGNKDIKAEAVERQVIQALSIAGSILQKFDTVFPKDVPDNKEEKQDGPTDIPF